MGACLSKDGEQDNGAKSGKGAKQTGAAADAAPGRPVGLSRVSVIAGHGPPAPADAQPGAAKQEAHASGDVAAADAALKALAAGQAVSEGGLAEESTAGVPAKAPAAAAAASAGGVHDSAASDTAPGGTVAGAAAAPAAAELDPVQQAKIASEKAGLAGRPYTSNQFGPPRPPFQSERLETVRAIRELSRGQAQDPDISALIANVLNLAVALFGTESAVVTLVEDDCFAVHSAAGKLGPAVGAELPWLTGICGFSLTPAHHEVLVVEDMAADARFNAEVRGGFDRFYCGAPLVAANGHRLGTLCLGDSQPKSLDAHQINMLCNMAEMVVRHVEQKWVETARRKSLEIGLKRTVAAYQRPFLFVEVGAADSGAWDIVHANSRASETMGVTVSAGERKPFWDALESAVGSAMPWTPFKSAVQRGVRFNVTGHFKGAPAGDANRMWLLQFRPAAKDALDEETQLLGVPAHVPRGASAVGNRFYTVELAPAPQHGSSATSTGSHGMSLVPALVPACFNGLELGPLLGKGSFGRVYRGYYHGEEVAVKSVSTKRADFHEEMKPLEGIMDTKRVEFNDKMEPLEAVLTGDKHHPNLVGTIGWAVTKPPLPHPFENAAEEAARIAALPDDESQTWLLLEFCDKPCLQDAIDRGMFRQGEAKQTSPPNMGSICATACEVAAGMAYLHSCSVVHGDLKGGNVLLKSAETPRGFEAKVADFGMARDLGVEKRVKSNKYGTITHCPPELIVEGVVSKGVDVWAFGVMLWELYHGTRAFAGLTHPQIMHAIGIAGTQLQFDRSDALPAHETYFDLAEACMSRNPEQRPAFEAMKLVLKSSADAWNKLTSAGFQTPKDLRDTECTSCVG